MSDPEGKCQNTRANGVPAFQLPLPVSGGICSSMKCSVLQFSTQTSANCFSDFLAFDTSYTLVLSAAIAQQSWPEACLSNGCSALCSKPCILRWGLTSIVAKVGGRRTFTTRPNCGLPLHCCRTCFMKLAAGQLAGISGWVQLMRRLPCFNNASTTCRICKHTSWLQPHSVAA